MNIYFILPKTLYCPITLPTYKNEPVQGTTELLAEIEDDVVIKFTPDKHFQELYVCLFFLNGFIGWDAESVVERFPELLTTLFSEEHGEETTI